MLSSIYNKFRRITTNQLYFPEIDGIRFVAIMLVLLFHAHGYFRGKATMAFADDPNAYSWLNTFLSNGDRGVELFFVLSGFILCLPFAHHYVNHGKKVILKRYYLRRVTRLEPPYFIAMTGIFLLQLAMHVNPASELTPSWLASLIYSHSLIYHHTPLLTVVAWSLEIEIQFYVLAPLLFRLLALPQLPRRVIMAGIIIIMSVLQHLYPPTFLSIYGFGQYFIAGILLADFYASNAAPVFFNKKWLALAALLCFLAIVYLPIKGETVAPATLFQARLALPFLICVFYYTILKNDVLKKIFSYKFIPIIGGMCYTIYLLHYTIISGLGRFTLGFHLTNYYLPNLFLQIILFMVPILLISSIFYLYIERPFMASKWLDMLLKKSKKESEAVMEAERK
jgi:peptidoglycan/LPS O-acetylase OafA/YrhL